MTTLSDFDATDLAGHPTPLSTYAGNVTLVVNTASECGFTPQYRGLQDFYGTYGDRGFTVLGFPCNQFGKQEPGTSDQIASFCDLSFRVKFPMFEKIDVNGADAHPLYVWLKKALPGLLGTKSIKWNFTKFLLDRQGNPVARYAPSKTPESLAPEIERLLRA